MNKFKRAFTLLPLIIFFSCASRIPVREATEPLSPSEIGIQSRDEYLTEDYLTIIAVGDNLYHLAMIQDGEKGDYEKNYSEIRTLVKAADIAFINQETLLGGEDFGFTGYPLFNSPQKLGQAVWSTGFNVINHANNHVMDKGEKAILATLDFWDKIPEVSVLGIHRSAEQRNTPIIIKKNNITVGFLSYTYGTNGISIPAGKSYLVSLVNKETMAKEIDAIRPICDFLAVSMHWGEEYEHSYSKNQKDLAIFLAEHKVDLIIGHHPHVIQPIEYIRRPDGKETLCYYSLGNLIAAHATDKNEILLGAMAYIKIKKNRGNDNGIEFEEAGAIPLVTHYEKNYTGIRVFPLYAYIEELAKTHLKNQEKYVITPGFLKNLSAEVMGEMEIAGNPFASALISLDR